MQLRSSGDNRFFIPVFFAGYSAIATLASKFDKIVDYPMSIIVIVLSGFIGIICLIWRGKNNYLNHRLNAVQKIVSRKDGLFKDLIRLEKSMHKDGKLFLKSISNLEPTHFDNRLPIVMFFISCIISAIAFTDWVVEII